MQEKALISNEFLLDSHEYLFRQAASRVAAYRQTHPHADILNMGIGDIVLPLAPTIGNAMQEAARAMASAEGMHGYPPAEGEWETLHAIRGYYADMGIDVSELAFAVGHGAKDELAMWSGIIDRDMPAMICAPCYPAYIDSAMACNRAVTVLTAADGLPMPPSDDVSPHIIYLCSPNNPTGLCYSIAQLQQWVNYALRTHSLLLFDAAYAAFAYPYGIFMCRGATNCAVEIGTLSKSASFSGIRFGWSAVGLGVQAGELWHAYSKYKSIMSNGVGHVVQRGALAALKPEGLAHSRSRIALYKKTAAQIGDYLQNMGLKCNVGPYIWLRLPDCFPEDVMGCFLEKGQLIVTDGAGFGACGKGYARLSVFAVTDNEQEVIDRLRRIFADYV